MNVESLRLDKWLWQARFCKSRTLAARLCQGAKMRLNREIVTKSHAQVRPGDVLTFPLGGHIRVVRIVALGTRRGPATEAQTLYEDLAPPTPESRVAGAYSSRPRRPGGTGRPTKADRRAVDRLRGRQV
ncbi:MAG: RNA-binding S4 domain-containing protein [Alphaproteobacteria bacterium]|nr:RNA-binding S4 domain-containing protein [Alphaproteobacteria bacterium]